MAREGILTAADRVELLEGWLVPKMTKNPPHRIVTRRVRLALEGAVPGNWYVESQEPIVTTDSEPEPDVCVIRGRTEDYSETNPPSEAVGLVVEIAEASLAVDRRLKTRVYARASIPVYWIVDLATRCVEVHELPSGPSESPTYARRTEVSAGRLRLILDGAEVALIDLADLFFPEG
ncbi:MAG: Uma2 family endonuclease [Deltaproteobacteria bacterium]|nr:Uma2 family endonuclease [Deltaproteobacteria bacterium]